MNYNMSSQPTRRDFVRAAGAVGGAAAATVLLSACDGGGAPAAAPEPFTIPADKVPVGSGIVLDDKQAVVTQPVAGEFHAFSNICTHKQCPLSAVKDLGAFCPCHSSYFDITTGAPVAGPAPTPLPELPVAVSGNTLTIG